MKRQRDNQQTAESFTDLGIFLTDTLAEGAKVSPEARRRIWQQAAAPAPSPARAHPRPKFRWAYAFTTFAILLGLMSGYVGAVLASGSAVPGDPLYGLERQVEEVWLSLTPTDKRSEVQLVLLERRIYEARALLRADQEAPPGLFQEIDLLFVAVTEDGRDEATLLSHLMDYRDILHELATEYPNKQSLCEALQTANTVVASLEGAPTSLPDPPE